MKYIKQLDSVRAIAVILVIISHWIPQTHFLNKTPNGAIGVNIFFVLSGFLISKILFDHRIKAEQLAVSKYRVVKNFYFRRILRIFPIYYLTIFILLIFHEHTDTNIKSAFLYFLTYTSNFYFFQIQHWDGMISHLWTLAVEEQFYLIWPWLMLLVNKKYLLHIILGFITIGVVSQWLLMDVNMSVILTFTCFDAFGLGALLAWQMVYRSESLNRLYTGLSIAAIVSVLLFFFGLATTILIFPLRTIVSIIALWLIAYIVLHQQNDKLKINMLLSNRILIFLGKISYGIYLYHHIIPSALNLKIIDRYLNPLLPDYLYKDHWARLYVTENAILLVLISWLSYVLIEKRFLNLKKQFLPVSHPVFQGPNPRHTRLPASDNPV
jgi:peptidoglycan/LPS O-acetylase OafA/YrhL